MISLLLLGIQGHVDPLLQPIATELLIKAERAMEVSHQQSTAALESTLGNYKLPGRRRILDCFSYKGEVASAANYTFTLDFFVAERRIANLRCLSVVAPKGVSAESVLPRNELRQRALAAVHALGPFPATATIVSDDFDEQVPGIYRARLDWKFHGLSLDDGPPALIQLNRRTGGLMSFQAGSPFPAWDPQLAVLGTTAQHCRQRAEAIYLQSGALPYANVFDVGFVYGYPAAGEGSAVQWQSDDPQYRELLTARKAILMYRVEYEWKTAYIDGRNGNPISVIGFDLGYGRTAGETSKLKDQIEGVRWSVLGRSKAGGLRFVRFEKGPESKGNVLLRDTGGKRIISGRFNLEAKTFSLFLTGGRLILEPDDKLRDELTKGKQR